MWHLQLPISNFVLYSNTLFGVVICGDGGDDDDDDTVNVFVFLFLFLCFQSISSFDH